eukprot:TRINITY_DN20400_c0_g1_i1.p2 TRINITY_DN20400_c0_g1~~TRINITY_DN20400_c0_g1_i1.p2  ORF type:complete len:207 (+),score=24.38 TRINITY_DN20400_c0_g1_i1:1386-2006(+)
MMNVLQFPWWLWGVIHLLWISPIAYKGGAWWIVLIHGVVGTITSFVTLSLNLDPTFTIMLSVAYFTVHSVLTYHEQKGFQSSLANILANYIHHVLGIAWGLTLLLYPHAPPAILYVYLQTNEFSTPFLSWYRATKGPLAGAAFAASFFLSRIVWNTLIVVPLYWASGPAIWFCFSVPYFIIQYFWFFEIAKKFLAFTKRKDKHRVE